VPFAIAGTEGFGIVSADGASRLITHWLLQSDLRAFLSSHSPTPDRETFLLRFGGMRLDATLERSFRAALFVNLAQNQGRMRRHSRSSSQATRSTCRRAISARSR
jgi:hypothetical protein